MSKVDDSTRSGERTRATKKPDVNPGTSSQVLEDLDADQVDAEEVKGGRANCSCAGCC